MRSVSSTDVICFVRIASADCRAVAKSSSCVDGTEDFAGAATDGEDIPVAGFDFPPSLSARTLEEVNAVAASANGTVERKLRRFICGNGKGHDGKAASPVGARLCNRGRVDSRGWSGPLRLAVMRLNLR